MARSKKRKVHRRRSRRGRVGAVDVKKVGMKIVGIAGGAFLAKTLNNVATKAMPTLDAKLVSLGDVVIGALIPKFVKSDLGQAIGDGMIAVGSLSLLQQMNVLSGVGALPRRVPSRVIGAGDRPFLSKMVGGTQRNYIRQTVGGGRGMGSAYSEMERMNRSALGAAHGLGALAMEE